MLEFDWDEHNLNKVSVHKVGLHECEEVFTNIPKIYFDKKHSQKETRYYAFGETNTKRKLCAVFILRGRKIRVITARDMSKKERSAYEKEI